MHKNHTHEELLQALKNNDNNKTLAAKSLGMPRKTYCHRLEKVCTRRPVKFEEVEPKHTASIKKKKKARYVITSAQNNTAIHQAFFKALKIYCEVNEAQLLVIPLRYKNVTAYIDDQDYEVTWPSELNSYYITKDLNLNDHLILMGSLKIQATALDPLSGIGPLAGDKSAIIGHPQIALEMIATPLSELPRKLLTTGSVSLRNYSESKAGKQAAFHHNFGAALVEIDGDKFFTRQLNATNDGSFYDLDKFYTKDGWSAGHQAEALVCGDIHALFLDESVEKATWTNSDSIVKTVKPKNQVLHDVLDFYSANHHHKDNFHLQYAKHLSCYNNVKDELLELAEKHNVLWSDSTTEYHYVGSNHNDALTRWLNEADPKKDIENAKFYFELQSEVFTHIENNANLYKGRSGIPNPLELFLRKHIKNTDQTHFHSRSASVFIKGIDVGQHGDYGINGAKGSKNSFAKTGYKTIIGHGHSPGIRLGCMQVGTSSKLNMGYNAKGYSNWMHTQALIYPNGKRTLIDIIKGQWRLK